MTEETTSSIRNLADLNENLEEIAQGITKNKLNPYTDKHDELDRVYYQGIKMGIRILEAHQRSQFVHGRPLTYEEAVNQLRLHKRLLELALNIEGDNDA